MVKKGTSTFAVLYCSLPRKHRIGIGVRQTVVHTVGKSRIVQYFQEREGGNYWSYLERHGRSLIFWAEVRTFQSLRPGYSSLGVQLITQWQASCPPWGVDGWHFNDRYGVGREVLWWLSTMTQTTKSWRESLATKVSHSPLSKARKVGVLKNLSFWLVLAIYGGWKLKNDLKHAIRVPTKTYRKKAVEGGMTCAFLYVLI